MNDAQQLSAAEIAAAVRKRELSARSVIETTLEHIERENSRMNCFTDTVRARALQRADALDARIRTGSVQLPLAGVPFGVKNLFDVDGLVTLAGSKIHRERPPLGRMRP